MIILGSILTTFELSDTSSLENQIEFTNILRTFHLIIALIVKLTFTQPGSENFKFSLKYDLNYIFMKIGKKMKRLKFFIYSFLNWEFLSLVSQNNIYSFNEMYEIM